jgi:hypothetical protein
MEVYPQVGGTPFVPCTVCGISDREAVDLRARVPIREGVPMIFYFGHGPDPELRDGYFRFFESHALSFPNGHVYAEFRRETALFRRSEFECEEHDLLIILVTKYGPDFLGYLIVRWLVDELGLSVDDAVGRFRESVGPDVCNLHHLDDLFRRNRSQPIVSLTPEQRLIVTNSLCLCRFRRRPPLRFSAISEVYIAPTERKPIIPKPRLEFRLRPLAAFESLGQPTESRQVAFLISSLNRKFDQLRTSPPFTPMRIFDKETIERIRMDAAKVYKIVPIPHGIRCLFYISSGHAVLISEKSVGRWFEVHGVRENTVFDGFVCDDLFIAIDALLIDGVDMRKRPYADRIAAIRKVMEDARPSGFRLECVSLANVCDYKEVLRSEAYLVAGMCLTDEASASGIGSEVAMFAWRFGNPGNPIVQVKFLRNLVKCVGIVIDRTSMKEVVDFGVAKPNLVALDGCCVELKYNHELRQWQIAGKTHAQKPWNLANFNKVAPDGVPPFTVEEFVTLFESLLAEERYRA